MDKINSQKLNADTIKLQKRGLTEFSEPSKNVEKSKVENKQIIFQQEDKKNSYEIQNLEQAKLKNLISQLQEN